MTGWDPGLPGLPPCRRWEAQTAYIYPFTGEECRHWLGGVACRLPDAGPCLTAGKRPEITCTCQTGECRLHHEGAYGGPGA